MLHRDGKLRRLILVFLGVWCALSFLCDAYGCYPSDEEALLEFKSSLVDPGSFMFFTWKPEEDCCTWAGIICSNETGVNRVVSLKVVYTNNEYDGYVDPSGNSSYGVLGSPLGMLEELQSLYLQSLQLRGPLPVEWSNLKNLESLCVEECSLEGQIDHIDWKAMPKLQYVWLQRNNLTGSIPSQLCRISSLTSLNLGHNEFRGPIPTCIHELGNLQHLYLSGNNLTGIIPTTVTSMSKLIHLDVSKNRIGGVIPISMGNMTALQSLQLAENALIGQLPPSLCTLSGLRTLSLSDNQLSGPIPGCLGNTSELGMVELSLSNNKLSGNFFISLLQVQYLYIDNNNLEFWSDHDAKINTSKLIQLDLSSNQMAGEIPLVLCNMSLLMTLNLADNFLYGPLPPCLGLLPTSVGSPLRLNLSRNFFTLEIPSSYGSGAITTLDLHRNYLSGGIEHVFSRSVDSYNYMLNQSLVYVDLSQNELTGPVPNDLALHYQLQYLTLAHNVFNGGFPPCVFNLLALVMLDLSDNEFTGELPPYLPALGSRLGKISLGNNYFSGTIPTYYDGIWGELEGYIGPPEATKGINFWKGGWDYCILYSLSLHNNNLTGPIPEALGKCDRLIVFDVSYNRFNGTLPSWLGSNSDLRVFMANYNHIEGAIADNFGGTRPSHLRVLSLSNNRLRGEIPSQSLQYLLFFTQPFPLLSEEDQLILLNNASNRTLQLYELYHESIMVSYKGEGSTFRFEVKYVLSTPILLDLSSNQLTGSIPSSLGLLSQTLSVNLRNNQLSGSIPATMANMQQLESMDLANNFLSGSIPPDFSKLSFLAFVNFSFNDLSGPIPQANQWSTFQKPAFMGNKHLCGPPTNQTCTADPSRSPPAQEEQELAPPPQSDGYAVEMSIPAFVIGYIPTFCICTYLFIFGYPGGTGLRLSFTPLF